MPGKVQIINGRFQDAEGNPLASGYITMELCTDAQETSGPSQIVGGLILKIPLDNNGNVADTTMVWPNDVLNPPNSCYLVDAFKQNGTRAWKAPQYQMVLSNPSPYDISVWVPSANGGCGCGNGQGAGLCTDGILFQTNGVNNGNQCKYNLVAGTGTTLADNGTGNITVTSTGAGIALKTNGVLNTSQSIENLIAGDGVTLVADSGGGTTITASGTTAFESSPAWWGSGDGSPYAWSNSVNGSFGTGTANQVKFWMIRIPYAIKVTRMDLRVLTGFAATLGGYAIYSSDGTTKFFSWDSIDTTTSITNRTITLGSPVILSPGVYIAACATSGSGASNPLTESGYATGGSSEPSRAWNIGGVIRSGTCSNSMSAGTMPSTLGTLSLSAFIGTAVPLITMEP